MLQISNTFFTMKIKLAIFSILFFIINSCTKPDTEIQNIHRTVGKYNMALVVAYKELDWAPLGEVTTEVQLDKVKHLVNSYLEGNQVMEAELHSLSFRDIESATDKIKVTTYEVWSFRWVDYKKRTEIIPLQEREYEIVYHLVREGDHLLISSVEDITAQK